MNVTLKEFKSPNRPCRVSATCLKTDALCPSPSAQPLPRARYFYKWHTKHMYSRTIKTNVNEAI